MKAAAMSPFNQSRIAAKLENAHGPIASPTEATTWPTPFFSIFLCVYVLFVPFVSFVLSIRFNRSGAGSGAGTGSAAGSGKLDNKWKQEMPITQNTVISSATNPLIECQGLLNGNTPALTPRTPT